MGAASAISNGPRLSLLSKDKKSRAERLIFEAEGAYAR